MQKTEKKIVIDYEGDKLQWNLRESQKKKDQQKIHLENKKEEERKKREAEELKWLQIIYTSYMFIIN